MDGLTFTLESMICYWRDGELVAVEAQNGIITRWQTQKMSRGQSLALFELDKVAPAKG